jgi:dienelactone hydrolase
MSVREVIGLGLAVTALAAGCVAQATFHRLPVSLPRPATLTADLYLPRGTGPFPALVLLHGCGGIQPNIPAYAHWLASEGYAALVLDSFGGRGLTRLCGDTSPLTGHMRHADVYAAATYLATLPSIDTDRIAAIGWSHGGWAVLWAASYASSFPDMRLRAFVAFYPPCRDTWPYRGSSPLLLLTGEKDDWTPAEPCRFLAQYAQEEGRDVTAIVYPGAHHGFDYAHLVRPTLVPDARGGQGATIAYDARAHADSARQVREFLRRTLGR